MRINTNMNAMTALNQMGKNTALAGTSMGKIASGQRINKAGDDAAGMAISEKMRSQIRGLDQAARNTQDGISVVQTAEGAMEEVGNIVQRMRELSVQSANETNSGADRTKITEELTQLHEEIDRIANSTQFNGKDLLNGESVIDTKVTSTITGNGYKIEGLDGIIEDMTDTITDGAEIKLATAASAGNTKITLTVAKAGGELKFELDGVNNNGGTAGALKAGEYTLTDAASGKSIKVTVPEIANTQNATKIGEADHLDTLGQATELQVGANNGESQTLNMKIANVSTEELGLTEEAIKAMKSEGTEGTEAARAMIDNLDAALEKVNGSRANLGAMQNRLETAQSNLTTTSENLTAAESRIRDVDVAKEMMNLSKLNLLTQASQAMMGQAKQQPEGVMQLLR